MRQGPEEITSSIAFRAEAELTLSQQIGWDATQYIRREGPDSMPGFTRAADKLAIAVAYEQIEGPLSESHSRTVYQMANMALEEISDAATEQVQVMELCVGLIKDNLKLRQILMQEGTLHCESLWAIDLAAINFISRQLRPEMDLPRPARGQVCGWLDNLQKEFKTLKGLETPEPFARVKQVTRHLLGSTNTTAMPSGDNDNSPINVLEELQNHSRSVLADVFGLPNAEPDDLEKFMCCLIADQSDEDDLDDRERIEALIFIETVLCPLEQENFTAMRLGARSLVARMFDAGDLEHSTQSAIDHLAANSQVTEAMKCVGIEEPRLATDCGILDALEEISCTRVYTEEMLHAVAKQLEKYRADFYREDASEPYWRQVEKITASLKKPVDSLKPMRNKAMALSVIKTDPTPRPI